MDKEAIKDRVVISQVIQFVDLSYKALLLLVSFVFLEALLALDLSQK